ncbi:hypothetical protein GPA22_15940 [Aromatoleum toluvorans]|uniref:Uncharacterized protein n=1 Tax=Aromatoleum toluvorans TaxID=92002 RepID=A0ABX1Q0J3_9RHOO|nr:hypothetical protein [Aromatoleum toluvorans]NMG45209.1 hypothetical protein [Aromatoleum toluvorans]
MPSKGSAQIRARRSAEIAALALLVAHEGEWLGAVELGERLVLKWRPLSFALRRLAKRGAILERIETYRGTARTKEERRLYCFAGTLEGHALLPAVRGVTPGVARRGYGRDWNDDSRDLESWAGTS